VRTSSCAGSNGATARVLSETHTSGFAARPKPPPESPPAENSKDWCKDVGQENVPLGRHHDKMAWRAAVNADSSLTLVAQPGID
jgi:hypothetical protein